MRRAWLIAVVLCLATTNVSASVAKQKLIDKRISLQHQIDNITGQIEAIEKDEATAEDKRKTRYYKKFLEKDNPVPENFEKEMII